MTTNGHFLDHLPDLNPEETEEWLEAFDEVTQHQGKRRARYLIRRVLDRARNLEVGFPEVVQTSYINTITPEVEPQFPGDEWMEKRIRRMIRWNAMAMVNRANHNSPGIGGHLSTYSSSASLYEVGFNHFFRGKDDNPGDIIYFQGHAAPGIYARAYLEGRLSEDQLNHFRREAGASPGLSSYPHPWLMPDFWEFPSVSMGLGPLSAIYQARFNRYLHMRGLADTSQARIWCFLGDGETDEPEALGSLSLASREKLDNLIFVVNCNLQRLDGPVRGNGKIIQELERVFRGAGWNVIKVIWGREWDELLKNDCSRRLLKKMNETVDGQFQRLATESGEYIRKNFFGPEPELTHMVEGLSDEHLEKELKRGGHDYRKLYAAYHFAVRQQDRPTVILAHTVKGWTLGEGFEGQNVTHQLKKLNMRQLRTFRDLLELPISDADLENPETPFYHPGPTAPEIEYMLERRQALGGCLPKRISRASSIAVPGAEVYQEFHSGSQKNMEFSTTMALVRLLRRLIKSGDFGKRIVPIIPDEARTFGMESLFKEVGIYSSVGQLYEPVDQHLLLSYRETKNGQVLEEGITEAGSTASFHASGTSYATNSVITIPFYIFYSMFGFQRTGDSIWAFGDARGRGFLIGATAGRTTLNGEGLQHQDGHSHLVASTHPNIRAYDPAFAYEVAVIIEDGIRRIADDQQDCFYYMTVYNENYVMPAMPKGVRDGILQGGYLYKKAANSKNPRRLRLLGSGSVLPQVIKAQKILADQYNVDADVYSITSYQLLRREALSTERWNRLHPLKKRREPVVGKLLKPSRMPTVAVSDFVGAVPDQISRWVEGPWHSLGTDGFGRSDTREGLRQFFEIDVSSIVAAALSALVAEGALEAKEAAEAIRDLGIDTDRPEPVTL